jgi:hypothetical protein
VTLIEKVARCMADGMTAGQIAAVVNRPYGQVLNAMNVVRFPHEEAERQARYHAKRRNDPAYIERKRIASRKYQARKRGVPTNDRGYVVRAE